MIDEAHRTQGSDLGENLFEAFPNDNILPDGFKAQVVCHSKLAAIRYRTAIREALAERLDRERLRPAPDFELIRRIAFLKRWW